MAGPNEPNQRCMEQVPSARRHPVVQSVRRALSGSVTVRVAVEAPFGPPALLWAHVVTALELIRVTNMPILRDFSP